MKKRDDVDDHDDYDDDDEFRVFWNNVAFWLLCFISSAILVSGIHYIFHAA
jgi:uncharacterized membrane protein